MNDAQARALMALHVDSVNRILDGAEAMVDARACAAVYIARAGKVLSALRQRGVVSRDEIDQLLEHLQTEALKDGDPGIARDGDGNEMLSPAEKAKAH